MSTFEESHGNLQRLCLLLLDAKERSYVSIAPTQDVAEIVTDPYRLAVADQYRRSLAYLDGVNGSSKDHVAALERVLSEYDSAAD